MKILCVSDQIDPLIYNPNARQTFPDIDLILCAGDLPMDYIDFIVSVFNKPTYFIFGNHNLTEYRFYNRSRLGQSDNSDLISEKQQPTGGHGAVYAGFRVIRDRNLSFTDPKTGKKTPLLIAGVSGSIRYNNGLDQYSEGEMSFKLLAMTPSLIWNKIRYGRYLDIFLTHAAPLGIHDHADLCHRGFRCFRRFIEKYSPQYLVHGHIHLYDQREKRVSPFLSTIVVNAFAHCVMEFPVTELHKNKENKK